MSNEIDWAAFASPYWRPTTDEQHKLVLYGWRQESKSYDDGKTQKPVLIFDVLKVDGEEFAIGKRRFVTGASSFAEQVRPMIVQAIARNEQVIHILLRYDKDKHYSLMDLYEPKKEYIGLKK